MKSREIPNADAGEPRNEDEGLAHPRLLSIAGAILAGLTALFDLLKQHKIKPLVARRFPLAEARHAQELLGKGGVTGKFVLVCNEQPLAS